MFRHAVIAIVISCSTTFAIARDLSLLDLTNSVEVVDIAGSAAFFKVYRSAASREVGRDNYARDYFARRALAAAGGQTVQAPQARFPRSGQSTVLFEEIKELSSIMSERSECRVLGSEKLLASAQAQLELVVLSYINPSRGMASSSAMNKLRQTIISLPMRPECSALASAEPTIEFDLGGRKVPNAVTHLPPGASEPPGGRWYIYVIRDGSQSSLDKTVEQLCGDLDEIRNNHAYCYDVKSLSMAMPWRQILQSNPNVALVISQERLNVHPSLYRKTQALVLTDADIQDALPILRLALPNTSNLTELVSHGNFKKTQLLNYRRIRDSLESLKLKVVASIASGTGGSGHCHVDFRERNFYFGVDSAHLAFESIDLATSVTRAFGQRDITISGNADDPGSNRHNYRLAMYRADTVAEELVRQGFSHRQLLIFNLGRACRQRIAGSGMFIADNRRVNVYPAR